MKWFHLLLLQDMSSVLYYQTKNSQSRSFYRLKSKNYCFERQLISEVKLSGVLMNLKVEFVKDWVNWRLDYSECTEYQWLVKSNIIQTWVLSFLRIWTSLHVRLFFLLGLQLLSSLDQNIITKITSSNHVYWVCNF